jgi:hypothetical protein
MEIGETSLSAAAEDATPADNASVTDVITRSA